MFTCLKKQVEHSTCFFKQVKDNLLPWGTVKKKKFTHQLLQPRLSLLVPGRATCCGPLRLSYGFWLHQKIFCEVLPWGCLFLQKTTWLIFFLLVVCWGYFETLLGTKACLPLFTFGETCPCGMHCPWLERSLGGPSHLMQASWVFLSLTSATHQVGGGVQSSKQAEWASGMIQASGMSKWNDPGKWNANPLLSLTLKLNILHMNTMGTPPKWHTLGKVRV